MPKGAYTAKQERKADHIAEGYRDQGVSKTEAEERAWRTVNSQDKGGKKSGSGRGHAVSHESSRRGGERSSRSRTHEERSAAAKKGWETRRRHGKG